MLVLDVLHLEIDEESLFPDLRKELNFPKAAKAKEPNQFVPRNRTETKDQWRK